MFCLVLPWNFKEEKVKSALASKTERGFSKIMRIYKTNAEKNVLNG